MCRTIARSSTRLACIPDDFRTLEDLANFPFTTKEDLRATYPFGMFAVPREQVLRIHASSGTTGKPTVVGYTANDLRPGPSWARARSAPPARRPGDMVHVAYGYGLFTGGLGAHYAAERLGCTVIPMSGGQTERQVQLIQDFKPHVIMVTPSYMLAIADEFERQGMDARALVAAGRHPRRRALDRRDAHGDRGAPRDGRDRHLRPLGGDRARASPTNASRPRTARTSGRTISIPRSSIPRPATPRPDGEQGELVFTSLTKEALPVIRYRTRDLTPLLPGTARSMRRMARITGRTDDMLIIRGVNVFPTQIEELILKAAGLSPHYVIEVTREGRLDEVEVVVECKPEHAGKAEVESDCARSLVHQIKSLIGISAKVRPVPPGGITRSMGKAKRVIDLRSKG